MNMRKTLLSTLTAAILWLCSTTGWSQTTLEIATAEEYAEFALFSLPTLT